MLLYEMFAIGIAVVLVVAAIGGSREPYQPSAASWPQQPSGSGMREPQQPSAASWPQWTT